MMCQCLSRLLPNSTPAYNYFWKYIYIYIYIYIIILVINECSPKY
ncbi:MAG: hypothetical protein N7Q72_02945 [Spiroplasma sp. Tabriz.8]|nr:hypothetical protein [Spiroplasma sp. Tabriz.8]